MTFSSVLLMINDARGASLTNGEIGVYVVGPSANFFALPGLQGEAAWAVGKSRSGKKLVIISVPNLVRRLLECAVY